ncbi:MAG: DNA internalization-related competence protein ComEC/Rec2 [bacterium]
MASKPALKVLLLYVLGLFFGKYFDAPPGILLSVCTLFVIAVMVLWLREKAASSLIEICLALGLILLGASRYEFSSGHFPPHHISNFANSRDAVAITGVVVRYPEKRVDKVNLPVAVKEIFANGQVFQTQGTILIRIDELDKPIHYGDEILLRGKLRRPRDQRNPGEFDYRAYLTAQGISGLMSAGTSSQVQVMSSGHGHWLLRRLIFPVKSYLDEYIGHNLPARESMLLRGLLIGERGEMSVELREVFSKLGVFHILAVSGLHVGFVILIFMGLLGFLRIPYTARVLLTIAALVFYAYLTNLKPPVVRASMMSSLLLFSTVLQRKNDVFNTLAVAALFILISNPLELFQPGFQLSFAAVTAIVYMYPKLRSVLRIHPLFDKFKQNILIRYPVELFLISAAAFLGTLPFSILYFERLPLFSLAANLVVIPLAFCGLATGITATVVHLMIPVIGQYYAAASWFFLHYLIEIVEWAGRLPHASLELHRFSAVAALFYFSGLLIVFNVRQPRARRWLLIYVLALLNILLWSSLDRSRNTLRITFFDVGQGDAVLLTFPDGRHALIDGGPTGQNYDAGEWVVAPYLKRNGISEIDALILSHADADHLGGLPFIMRNFKVHEIWDNGQAKPTELYQEYVALIDSLHIKRRVLRAGDALSAFNPVRFFVIHPTERFLTDFADDVNEGSLSLRMSYGEIDFLLSGDIEQEGEKEITRFGDLLKSEVLKVSHHGSRTSSTPAFVNLVEPQLAVISVGELNKFEHPHPEALERLQAAGAEILRTDRDAAVILETDGRQIKRVQWR